jgi:hypothetical protein
MITNFKLFENNMTEKEIINFYENQLDIPKHKISYVLNDFSTLIGAFGSITHYGIDLTEYVFNIFYDVISAKLEGTYDVEHEFENDEYDNLMKLKQYLKK